MLDTTTVTLNISDEAQSRLREIIESRNEPNLALRVFAQGMGGNFARYGMTLDAEQLADDAVVEFPGFKVLVDHESVEFVHESEIGYQDGLMGAGFTLENPRYEQAPSGGCCGGHGGAGCGCQH
jgi:iron-sulfur cluster assembly accessory protein